MRNWTVKRKLATLVASIIIAFVCLTVFLLGRQAAATADIRSLYDKDYRAASIIGQIDGLLTRVDINILRMIAIGDPASISGWKAQNTERFNKVDQLLVELDASADPSMAASIKTLGEAYGRMRKGMEHQVEAVEAGDIKRGGEINKNEVKDNADKTFGTLAELKSAQDLIAKNKVQAQEAAAALARVVSITAAALIALGSLGLGLLMLRDLLRQLGGEPSVAAQAVSAMAQGDLSRVIAVDADDRTSLLAKLKEMQASLSGIVATVRNNAESVATASAQIAQGNQDLSHRTEQQASALQETSATMDELGSTVGNNAENARQANQLASGASSVAAEGGEVVSQVVGMMKGINDGSKKIADIIGVIDGIAFQTNILALNAAVEAARAGEQGRGFAVVASEVRTLAQRSSSAAKDIKELIGASLEKITTGSGAAEQAGRTMQAVTLAVEKVTAIIHEITQASEEQTSGIEQISHAMGQMDQVTQHNAALVEQAAAASQSLEQQGRELDHAVASFRLA